MLNIFSCAHCPSVCLLWKKCLFSSSTHFFNWIVWFLLLLLSCVSSLNILVINLLSDISFTNVFFHSICCLFVLLLVYFAVQKFFSLMKYHLFLLLFPLPEETYLERYCQDPGQRGYYLCFLPGVLWFHILHSSL